MTCRLCRTCPKSGPDTRSGHLHDRRGAAGKSYPPGSASVFCSCQFVVRTSNATGIRWDRVQQSPSARPPLRARLSWPKSAVVRGEELGQRDVKYRDGIMHLTKQGPNRENPARVLSAFTACRLAG